MRKLIVVLAIALAPFVSVYEEDSGADYKNSAPPVIVAEEDSGADAKPYIEQEYGDTARA